MQASVLWAVAGGSPDDLSGGGKQRVALARALAIRPDVMLLDEPLSSLDPHFREEMRFEIKDLQRRFGFSILYVTHDQAEAMALSDRILVMKDGIVQQIGTPLEVYSAPANRFVFEFIGLSTFLEVGAAPDGLRVDGAVLPAALGALPLPLAGVSRAVLAARPGEIDFTDGDGVAGRVARRAYLGDLVDYRIRIGEQEIRVQKPRHVTGPREGESCAIAFRRPRWYPAAAA